MKKNIHPKYQQILFIDSATGKKFVCGSTLQPKGTEKFEGKDYPVSYLPTSSYSHPYFTGSNALVDAAGRVEKFKNKYAKKNVVPPVATATPATKEKKPAKKAKA